MRVFYGKAVYDRKEIKASINVLKKKSLSLIDGPSVKELENKIAKIFEKEYCLYVNSGSSALYLGIEAYDFEPGSEVITPALTFSTTIGCLIKNNLVPVFTDVELLTYCIDVKQIEELITDKTVAILAPNLLGNLCDWEKIRSIANKYDLKVIEDSADTLGATLKNIPSGKFSDMSITSFYGSHIINCAGNGGALTLNDIEVFKRAKLLRSWGRSSSLFDEQSEAIENRFNINLDGIEYDAKFVFEEIGYNLEGNEVGAAFGLAQLRNLKNNIIRRQENFLLQCDFFKNYNDYFDIPKVLPDVSTAWLAFPLLLKENISFNRKQFQIYLEEKDIQTRVVFTGNILRQPMCRNIEKVVTKRGLANSDLIMKNGVLLPLHHGMTENMFERLHHTIDQFIREFG